MVLFVLSDYTYCVVRLAQLSPVNSVEMSGRIGTCGTVIKFVALHGV